MLQIHLVVFISFFFGHFHCYSNVIANNQWPNTPNNKIRSHYKESNTVRDVSHLNDASKLKNNIQFVGNSRDIIQTKHFLKKRKSSRQLYPAISKILATEKKSMRKKQNGTNNLQSMHHNVPMNDKKRSHTHKIKTDVSHLRDKSLQPKQFIKIPGVFKKLFHKAHNAYKSVFDHEERFRRGNITGNHTFGYESLFTRSGSLMLKPYVIIIGGTFILLMTTEFLSSELVKEKLFSRGEGLSKWVDLISLYNFCNFGLSCNQLAHIWYTIDWPGTHWKNYELWGFCFVNSSAFFSLTAIISRINLDEPSTRQGFGRVLKRYHAYLDKFIVCWALFGYGLFVPLLFTHIIPMMFAYIWAVIAISVILTALSVAFSTVFNRYYDSYLTQNIRTLVYKTFLFIITLIVLQTALNYGVLLYNGANYGQVIIQEYEARFFFFIYETRNEF